MASQYFAILTDYGTRAFAQALSQGQPLQLTQFAVGDGNGQAVTPTASATALVHQTHIAPVSAVSLDPRNNKQVIVELTIPENIGGFYIREMGVFDAQNKLIAYANCPESFKPTESSGSGKVQVLRMILKVESSSAVTLSIDNSVIFVTRQQMTPKTITATTQNGFDESGHTHEIAKSSITQQGIVQLTNDTGLESESLALTAKAGKKLAQQTAQLQLNVSQNYINNSKKSSAVNSNSADTVATSVAVKTAYDKAVEAKTTADAAQRTANSKQSPATTLAGYGIGNFKVEEFRGNLNELKTDGVYAIRQASLSQNLPVSISCHIQVIAGGDSSWCRQLAYVAYSSDVYERHQTSYQTDNWSEWLKINDTDSLRRSLSVDKSDAVNSLSSTTVATSRAVKTAYDKGVDAKNAADNAQRTANDGVSKADAAQRTANDGINRANNAQSTAENAQSTANNGVYKANAAQVTANDARHTANNAQSSANAANYNANGRIPKSDISHLTNGSNKAKVASEFALGEINKVKANLADFSYQKIGNFEVRKYPDGTMIQTYFVDFYDVHGPNSGLGGTGQKQLTWATSFVGKPLVWGNITSSFEDYHDVGVNILTKSTATTLYWYNYEHGHPDQGACSLQFLAIGRWKGEPYQRIIPDAPSGQSVRMRRRTDDSEVEHHYNSRDDD